MPLIHFPNAKMAAKALHCMRWYTEVKTVQGVAYRVPHSELVALEFYRAEKSLAFREICEDELEGLIEQSERGQYESWKGKMYDEEVDLAPFPYRRLKFYVSPGEQEGVEEILAGYDCNWVDSSFQSLQERPGELWYCCDLHVHRNGVSKFVSALEAAGILKAREQPFLYIWPDPDSRENNSV